MNQHFSNILFGWWLWHKRILKKNALNEFGKAVFLCLLFVVAEKSQRCVMDSYGRFDTWKQNQHNECAMSGSIVKRILLLYIKRIWVCLSMCVSQSMCVRALGVGRCDTKIDYVYKRFMRYCLLSILSLLFVISHIF